MDEQAKVEAERYERACHAVQSGVAFEQARGSEDGTPKHLRTGLNLRACDHAALVRLLIDKGVITELEYLTEIANEAEREKERYEKRASDVMGKKVTFG